MIELDKQIRLLTMKQANLEYLKWTKSVKPQNGESWAYPNKKPGDIFFLHWTGTKRCWGNACKLQKGDLILLTQNRCVTHLVEVLDDEPTHEEALGVFCIYRKVKMCSPNIVGLKAVYLFDFPEILRYQGSEAHSLKTSATFKQRWDKEGGLRAFHERVANKLNLISIYLRALLTKLNADMVRFNATFDPAYIEEFIAQLPADVSVLIEDEDEAIRAFNIWLRTR
jgi:hypothetical protein